jgi:hypothetical protein
MVFLSTCWSVLSLGQCSRCSSSMVEFGIWHIVHSLHSYMPIELLDSHVLSLKFSTASYLGLPLYSAKNLWISLHFFVAASWSASCLYFVAILQFKSFFSELAWDDVTLVCNVVPFLASLSAISLPSSPTWDGNQREYDYVLESLEMFDSLFWHLSSLISADCWKKLLG